MSDPGLGDQPLIPVLTWQQVWVFPEVRVGGTAQRTDREGLWICGVSLAELRSGTGRFLELPSGMESWKRLATHGA